MGEGASTLAKTLEAIEQKAELRRQTLYSKAQAAEKEAEELFAKAWAEAKKQLESVAQEMKEKISGAIDRLLKKIEEEVMKGGREGAGKGAARPPPSPGT